MPAFSGQVPVCMACGGRDIRPQASGDGLWPGGGEGVAWVCDTCHHLGAPLLVDPRAVESSVRDRLMQQEADEVGQALEDERWDGAPPPLSARPLGVVLGVLGTAFLVPAVLSLQMIVAAGDLLGVLRAALPIVWLLGIGIALLAVGLRLYRRPAQPAA